MDTRHKSCWAIYRWMPTSVCMAALPRRAEATAPIVRWWQVCWASARTIPACRTARVLSMKAASVGGGRIRVTEIDGVPADFGGDSNTLIIHNEDTPGCIAEVTTSLALRRINIASMQVFRAGTGSYAVMVLECDSHIPHPLEQQLALMPGILKVTCLNVDEPEENAED